MNRKGQEAWVLIAAIIALLVLAGVFLGLKYFKSDVDFTFGLLPSFGGNKTTAAAPEIVALKISNGRIYYYTGTKWEPKDGTASGGQTFNDKTVDFATLQKEFSDYYLTSQRSAQKFSRFGDNKVTITTISPTSVLATDASTNTLEGRLTQDAGDVFAYVVPDSTGRSAYDLVVKYDGSIWKATYNAAGERGPFVKDSSSELIQVRDFIVSWRDSVLKQPIWITYQDKNNVGISSPYCVKKVSPDYLVAYLNNPRQVSDTSECPL